MNIWKAVKSENEAEKPEELMQKEKD